jgi:hypothetical protein
MQAKCPYGPLDGAAARKAPMLVVPRDEHNAAIARDADASVGRRFQRRLERRIEPLR